MAGIFVLKTVFIGASRICASVFCLRTEYYALQTSQTLGRTPSRQAHDSNLHCAAETFGGAPRADGGLCKPTATGATVASG